MVEVSNNFKQECEANVGAYKFGKIKVNYIDDNPLNYEQGAYSSSSGAKIEDNQSIRSVNLVECKPSFKYKIELGNSAYKMKIITYTEAQAFIATHDNLVDGSEVTTEATAKYLSVTIYSTDILEGTSILLNGTSRNGSLTGAELEGNTTQNGTPTPTTPIEVNNVTGEQVVTISNGTDSKSYEINLGKNLANPSNFKFYTQANASCSYDYETNTLTMTTLREVTSNELFLCTKIEDSLLKNGKSYTISSTNVSGVVYSLKLQLRNKNGTNASKPQGTTITYDNNYSLFIVDNPFASSGSTVVPQGTIVVIKDIQVEEGSSASDFTPYFEPIELNKIGNYQDFIRKGTGKNILLGTIETKTANNVTITKNSGNSCTITTNGTASATTFFYTNEDTLLKANTTYLIGLGNGNSDCQLSIRPSDNSIQYANTTTTSYVTYTPTEDINVRLFVRIANGKSVNETIYPYIQEGTDTPSYEPYGYKDKWYIEKNVGKLVLNGTESGLTKSSTTSLDRFYIDIYNGQQSDLIYSLSLCDHFSYNKSTNLDTFYLAYTSSRNATSVYFNYTSYGTTTLAQFKTWLSSNNIKVYYVLANPTYTLIENEELLNQLEEFSHAQTQEGITNILVSGNLPATLDIERDLTDSIKGRQLKPFIGYSITGDDDLISFKITSKADSSKSFIGSCVTKQIDLEIFNAENKHSLENKQIIVSTGMAETAGNFVTFEPFTITGTKDNKTKDKINYVGYDDMYKLNTAYVDTNTYGEDGITLYSFLESLASNANTSLGNESIPNGDFIVDGNPFTNNETNMFALSQVAKLSGGFAEIGRDNKIYIKTLAQDTPTMTLDTNLYSEDFEKAENFGAVNKVVVGESNISGNEAILSDLEDIELNGEHVVEILDSYFLSDDADKQIICAELFDNLKGLYYLPFSATCNGFPYLDLGDVIEIEDKNGDTYLTYLLNYELSYNGGYKEKIGAEAQNSTETKYKNVNTIKDKFKQVEIDVDKANAQIKSVIKKSDDNYTSITQTIGGITTQVQTATTTAGNAMTAVGNLAQGTQQQFNDLTEALSSLRQSVNNIQALFRVTGGANLIQNSVGFFQNSSGAPTMWNVSQGIAGFKHGYDSELLGQTTSQGKFYIRNGTISTTEDDATLETEANISGIEIGSLVTLSFKYKQSADSTTTITLANGETTFFTATFSEEVEDWTSYSDEDNTNSFICTTDSLVLTITNTSTYNTDDQGFMISDLILNYGEAKTWELHSGESYGGVIQLSSQGISVKSSSANTITYMTSDGIEVFETTQGDVLGDLITKLTSNGIETKDFVATGDITTRNLITTMIKDTSNNDIYIEYIKDE